VPLRRSHSEAIQQVGEVALAEVGAEGGLIAAEDLVAEVSPPQPQPKPQPEG
jgi:hypothetical protein